MKISHGSLQLWPQFPCPVTRNRASPLKSKKHTEKPWELGYVRNTVSEHFYLPLHLYISKFRAFGFIVENSFADWSPALFQSVTLRFEFYFQNAYQSCDIELISLIVDGIKLKFYKNI